MAWEMLNYVQDVGEHLRVARKRRRLRQRGRGVDYLSQAERVGEIVARLHPRRMRLRVMDIVQETPSSKTFRLERIDGPLPPFRAGQYVNLFVDVDGVLTSRPYSISSAPPASGREAGAGKAQPPLLDLTVKDKPGGFVAPYLLSQVQVGDELETTGPSGSFYYEPLIDGRDLVFLAGGCGITPFMSILRSLAREPTGGALVEAPLRIQLLYGSRTPDDVLFGQELEQMAEQHLIRYSLVVSEPPPNYVGKAGFLDAERIRQEMGKVAGKTFYMCGPKAMLDLCLAALNELGVPLHKIRRELYGPPDDVTAEPGWPSGLARSRIFSVVVEGHAAIQAPAGEPLLNSLERYGIVVPALCRAGECSSCRVRVLSGRVFMPAHVHVRESDREHGYVHACVAYPISDLRLRL